MQENMFTNWFKNRKISDSILSEFNVHWGSNPIFGECIVIPVLNEKGIFIFNKYRRNPMDESKPKYIYDKGGQVTIYGLHKAKTSDRILITEGELDCLTAWSANIPAITSTGGAMSFQEEWAVLLKDKDVTICFDNDEAGAKGMVKVLEHLPTAHVCFLPDRPGIKDITDYVSAGGDLAELLRTRVHFKSLQDVIDDRASRLATWQSVFFHDAYIATHTVPTFVRTDYKSSSDDKSKLAQAKQYPITDLLKFDKSGNTKCIFHNEKSASLHYYKNTNTVYCFGCGKSGDAITVYRAINNCSFKEAIEKLI